MAKFKDNSGQEWCPAVTVAAIKRVRQHLDVDLLDLDKGAILQRLAMDHVLLVDVLFVVCQAQAETLKITDEAFGEAMRGDVLAEATDAFLEELALFFPREKRDIMLTMLRKFRVMESTAMGRVAAVLNSDQLDRAFQQTLDKELAPEPAQAEDSGS